MFVACGGTLEGSSGTFTSPNHPNNYPDGVNCTWYITAEPGELIRLTFTTFILERHSSCYYDYVALYNNFTTAGLIDRYVVTLVRSSFGLIRQVHGHIGEVFRESYRQVRGHIGEVFIWSYKAGTWSHC